MRQYKQNKTSKQFKKYNNLKKNKRFKKKLTYLFKLEDKLEYYKAILPIYKPTYKIIEKDNKKIYVPK